MIESIQPQTWYGFALGFGIGGLCLWGVQEFVSWYFERPKKMAIMISNMTAAQIRGDRNEAAEKLQKSAEAKAQRTQDVWDRQQSLREEKVRRKERELEEKVKRLGEWEMELGERRKVLEEKEPRAFVETALAAKPTLWSRGDEGLRQRR
jgi:hypothetical protein